VQREIGPVRRPNRSAKFEKRAWGDGVHLLFYALLYRDNEPIPHPLHIKKLGSG
jgi:hypothetical protein